MTFNYTLPRYFLKHLTYSICDRSHFDDEDLTDLYRERAKIAMPDKYQDNLGCAKQYNRNEGLCPGDSGSTVGERSDFKKFLKRNYHGIPLIILHQIERTIILQ